MILFCFLNVVLCLLMVYTDLLDTTEADEKRAKERARARARRQKRAQERAQGGGRKSGNFFRFR